MRRCRALHCRNTAIAVCVLLFVSLSVAPCQQQYEEREWPALARTAAGTPSPWHFGEVAAVATTVRGNILVFHRGAHPVMEFTTEGEFVRSWGDGLISEGKVVQVVPPQQSPTGSRYTVVYGPAGCYSCGAHSIRVDPQGSVWVVDAAAHVVYKMDSEWRIRLQLGERGVAGDDHSHFNLPTDVAFAPNGDLYVSDGYGGARVVKFSKDGEYLLEWGERGTAPGEFGLPHNLVVDAQGRVYVTDRDNRRIQVFDADGEFLDQWDGIGGISTLFITEDQKIWAGGVLRDLAGKVVARLAGDVGGHGTTVTADGDVFVAQLEGRIQRFVRR